MGRGKWKREGEKLNGKDGFMEGKQEKKEWGRVEEGVSGLYTWRQGGGDPVYMGFGLICPSRSNKLPEPAKSTHLHDNCRSSILGPANCGISLSEPLY